MDELRTAVTDTKPVATGQNLQQQSAIAPASKTETPKTPSPQTNDVERKIQLALMKAGRDAKSLESQRQQIDKALAELKEERLRKEREEEERLKDQPDELDLFQKKRKLRQQEEEKQAEWRKHDEEWQSKQERIARAEAFEREVAIREIVEGFEGGDFDKLKAICEKTNTSDPDAIRDIADTMWAKQPVKPATPVQEFPEVDSAMTSGGSDNIGNLSPKDQLAEIDRRLRKK